MTSLVSSSGLFEPLFSSMSSVINIATIFDYNTNKTKNNMNTTQTNTRHITTQKEQIICIPNMFKHYRVSRKIFEKGLSSISSLTDSTIQKQSDAKYQDTQITIDELFLSSLTQHIVFDSNKPKDLVDCILRHLRSDSARSHLDTFNKDKPNNSYTDKINSYNKEQSSVSEQKLFVKVNTELDQIITKYSISVEDLCAVKEKYGWTLLHAAVWLKNKYWLAAIIDRLSIPQRQAAFLSQHCIYGTSVFQLVCLSGNVQVAQWVLDGCFGSLAQIFSIPNSQDTRVESELKSPDLLQSVQVSNDEISFRYQLLYTKDRQKYQAPHYAVASYILYKDKCKFVSKMNQVTDDSKILDELYVIFSTMPGPRILAIIASYDWWVTDNLSKVEKSCWNGFIQTEMNKAFITHHQLFPLACLLGCIDTGFSSVPTSSCSPNILVG